MGSGFFADAPNLSILFAIFNDLNEIRENFKDLTDNKQLAIEIKFLDKVLLTSKDSDF